MKSLTVATTNPGKIHEIRLALGELRDFGDFGDWEIQSLPQGTPVIEESGATFMENASLKATQYSLQIAGLVLADDSGLCVQALGGRPGVWSARYGPTSEDRNRRVLAELSTSSQREAVFHCVFAVAHAGSIVWTTEGEIMGEIVLEPVGTEGFGFDPIFFVPELRKTLAQMTLEEKNRISARGKALMELRRFLTAR